MTAENGGGPGGACRSGQRFNEAAADDRGKRPGRGGGKMSHCRFNEAAADDRGKRVVQGLANLRDFALQ